MSQTPRRILTRTPHSTSIPCLAPTMTLLPLLHCRRGQPVSVVPFCMCLACLADLPSWDWLQGTRIYEPNHRPSMSGQPGVQRKAVGTLNKAGALGKNHTRFRQATRRSPRPSTASTPRRTCPTPPRPPSTSALVLLPVSPLPSSSSPLIPCSPRRSLHQGRYIPTLPLAELGLSIRASFLAARAFLPPHSISISSVSSSNIQRERRTIVRTRPGSFR
nr:related to finger protein XFG 68 [imported] - Neurospora crassa [Neurospora crassa]